jgi:hypothetical protein
MLLMAMENMEHGSGLLQSRQPCTIILQEQLVCGVQLQAKLA